MVTVFITALIWMIKRTMMVIKILFIKYIETLKEYIKVALKFIETRAKGDDFDTRDYYFKDEHELKDFINITKKHMILINNIVLSNFNQVEGKLWIMHTYFNQKKSEELQRLLNKRICPIKQKESSEIFIQTIEQLKLLKELSINFNTLEFTVR